MALEDLLAGPMDGVARVVVRHERRRRFRWMFVPELLLVLLSCACLIPLAVVLALVTGQAGPLADLELDDLLRRAFRSWHEIVVELRGAQGRVLGTASRSPADRAEGEALLRSVVGAADRAGVVVVETLGGSPAEHLATWWGGQPLLAGPDRRALDALERIVGEAATVARTDDALAIEVSDAPPSRIVALLLLVVAAPLLAWTADGRRRLGGLLADVRGVPPAVTRLVARADGLLVERSRGGGAEWAERFDATELLGLGWAASLGYDDPVRRHPPRLEILGSHRTLQVALPDRIGPAATELLVGATLALRDRRPLPGVRGSERSRAHCPYCATMYVFRCGARCPSCGAPPTADWRVSGPAG